jgi:PKD repeat protein
MATWVVYPTALNLGGPSGTGLTTSDAGAEVTVEADKAAGYQRITTYHDHLNEPADWNHDPNTSNISEIRIYIDVGNYVQDTTTDDDVILRFPASTPTGGMEVWGAGTQNSTSLGTVAGTQLTTFAQFGSTSPSAAGWQSYVYTVTGIDQAVMENTFAFQGAINIPFYVSHSSNMASEAPFGSSFRVTRLEFDYTPLVYTAPVASFTASETTTYVGSEVTFTDTSANSPTAWQWAVTGGSQGTDYTFVSGSTSSSATIRFDTAGSYGVSLQASNPGGSDTSPETTITVDPIPDPGVPTIISSEVQGGNSGILEVGSVGTYLDFTFPTGAQVGDALVFVGHSNVSTLESWDHTQGEFFPFSNQHYWSGSQPWRVLWWVILEDGFSTEALRFNSRAPDTDPHHAGGVLFLLRNVMPEQLFLIEGVGLGLPANDSEITTDQQTLLLYSSDGSLLVDATGPMTSYTLPTTTGVIHSQPDDVVGGSYNVVTTSGPDTNSKAVWAIRGIAGEPVTSGTSTGSWSVSGASTGAAPAEPPPNEGASSGSWAVSGAASGSAPAIPAQNGDAAASWAVSGTATGTAPVIAGASGDASGSWTVSGAGAGTAPAIAGASGDASGSWTVSGAGSGSSPAIAGASGGASGAWSASGAATGAAPAIAGASGGVSGSWTITGTGTGTAPAIAGASGGASGSWAASGSASGAAPSVAGEAPTITAGTPVYALNTESSVTVTVPATQVGEVSFVYIVVPYGYSQPTVPSGWTALHNIEDNVGGAASCTMRTYMRVYQEGDPATIEWNNPSQYTTFVPFALSGLDTASVVAQWLQASESEYIPSGTATDAKQILVGLVGGRFYDISTPGAWSAPGMYSLIDAHHTSHPAADTSHASVLYKQVGATGATGVITPTTTGSEGTYAVQGMLLNVTATLPLEPPAEPAASGDAAGSWTVTGATSGASPSAPDVAWIAGITADGVTGYSDGQVLTSDPPSVGGGTWVRTGSPKWVADIAGTGRPAIEFQADSLGATQLSRTPSYTDPSVLTAVIVGQVLTASGGDLVDGGTVTRRLLDTDGATWRVYTGGVTGGLESGGTADTGLHLFIAEFHDGDSSIPTTVEVDTVQVISAVTGQDSNGLLVVGSSNNGEHFGSRAAFVGFIDRALTTQEKADLWSWSVERYGLVAGASGDASGAWSVSGAASGTSPVVGGASGNVSGSWTVSGTATGSAALPTTLVWDGAQAVQSTVYVWDGAQAVPATMRAVPHGYQSVSAMLAEDTFYWAHRGGSAVVPEMSLYAYTRAADQGFGGLEVSLARTSDGVWFGLHDTTLLRTSGVDLDPTTMTWAEVQQYTIAAPPGYPQPSQPYMRIEELIEAYGDTHVLIVDPKYQLANSAALLDYLLTLMPASRLIAKYAGNGQTLADIARPRGIVSWGYYYESSWSANKSFASAWDLIGMEWNASQATWDDVLLEGKPTVAHICATRSAADTGIAKGADGIQASGIFNVLTRE